jgi:hypothetical protein
MNQFLRTKTLASLLLVAALTLVIGVACQDGAAGNRGPAGQDGSDGVPGAAGVQGSQGQKGSTGSQGVQGVQGPQGKTGNVGPAGDRGSRGPQGVQGVGGADGAAGTDAVNGSAQIDLASNVIASGTTESATIAVTVLGAGFAASEIVLIEVARVGQVSLKSSTTANSLGAFSASISLKGLTPGTYSILAQGSAGTSAATPLQVVAVSK